MRNIFYLLIALFGGFAVNSSNAEIIEVIENRAAWDTSDVNNKRFIDNQTTYSYYDGNDVLLENYLYNLYDGVKSKYEHNSYQYNSNGKIGVWSRNRFIGNEWMPYYKKEYSYIEINEKYYLSETTEYMASGNELKPTQKKKYVYTSAGLLDSLYFYQYINEFKLATINKFEYSPTGKVISSIEFTNYDEVFEPSLKVVYTYNENDLLIDESNYNNVQNNWNPVERKLYTHYSDGNVESTTWQNFNGDDAYINFKRYLEMYHPNGKFDKEIHVYPSEADNNAFYPRTQFRNEYDEEWVNIATYYDVYANGKWEYETKYYYVSTSDVENEEIDLSRNEIYPNPASDLIMLKSIKFDKAQIIDACGRIVKNNISYGNNIDVKGLTPGTYFFRAISGNKIDDIQFIIER